MSVNWEGRIFGWKLTETVSSSENECCTFVETICLFCVSCLKKKTKKIQKQTTSAESRRRGKKNCTTTRNKKKEEKYKKNSETLKHIILYPQRRKCIELLVRSNSLYIHRYTIGTKIKRKMRSIKY